MHGTKYVMLLILHVVVSYTSIVLSLCYFVAPAQFRFTAIMALGIRQVPLHEAGQY